MAIRPTKPWPPRPLMKAMMLPATSPPRRGVALPNSSCRMMPSASRAMPMSVNFTTTILARSNHSISCLLSFLLIEWRGSLAVEQVENDGDRHQSDDAVATQRGHQLHHIANNVAEEGDIGAEEHLQHDAEGDQQEAQLRDPYDPGFGPIEHFRHLLFLRLTPECAASPTVLSDFSRTNAYASTRPTRSGNRRAAPNDGIPINLL